jgi:diguanylate cyclase (GGDEF)-like protein/PAS domain S-box-containing protein
MRNQAEVSLSALIESTENLIWAVDLDYRLMAFNRALRQEIEGGFGRRPVVGLSLEELLPPEQAVLWPPFYQRVLAQGPFRAEYSIPAGRTFELAFSPIVADGRTTGISVFGRDVTRRKQAERQLRDSEAHYRSVFNAAIDCISISRLSDGKLVDVNQAFLDLLGFRRDEVIGRACLELGIWVDPQARDDMAQILRQNAHFRDGKTRYRKKDGEIIWVLISASVLEVEGDACMLSIARDISDAKAAEDRIWNLAFYDPLTHLPNRRLLLDRLRQNLAADARTRCKRALLFVDLDNFKTLNDTLGHQNGDLLLQEIAQRLAACVRAADTVARLGGDEFVVLLDDLSEVPEEAAAQAGAVGQKMLAAVGRPYVLDGRDCTSTASIGIAVFGGKRESANEILRQGDMAMYQAKAAGRNTLCFFAPALQAAVRARAALESDLGQAIKAGQFVLYYQPLVDGASLIGAEALLRWNHPRRGLLPPGEFISLAEKTALILPLGDWILEAACTRIAAWAKRNPGKSVSVSVNFSARQLRQPGFVDWVLAVLERTGAPPQSLDLELTEGMLLENVEGTIAKMNDLRARGLRFSLDNFGTGYFSLACLRRLPLDQLKLDRSLVRDIPENGGSRVLAQSVISLGEALGLTVIAEGVETEQQREALAALGCHVFQGYLFSRPLPPDRFERLWLGANGGAGPSPR